MNGVGEEVGIGVGDWVWVYRCGCRGVGVGVGGGGGGRGLWVGLYNLNNVVRHNPTCPCKEVFGLMGYLVMRDA